MHPILRNILAVIGGFLIGGVLNGFISGAGPLPEGVIPGDMDSYAKHIGSFEFKHFIAPFLGHALGTLLGAFLAAKIAATRKMLMAMIIGIFFLCGGIAAVAMLGGPVWFMVTDLVVAYLPMAYLAGKLGDRKKA